MRSNPRRAALAAACLLAGVMATACAGPPAQGARVSYTCCSARVVATTWHPGQQLPVAWTRVGSVPPSRSIQPVTLSAVMTGPFKDVNALKAAVSTGQLERGEGSVTASAPELQIFRNPPRSPVSVITIPPNAPAGFYNLQFTLVFGQGGGSESGDTIITVG